ADQYGSLGQRGSPDGIVGPVDVTLPLGAFATRVASGGVASCVALASGEALCWGVNSGLGRGVATGSTNQPDLVLYEDGGTVTGIAELKAGADFVCARLVGGAVVCWGGNAYGQLGDLASTGLFAGEVPLPR